MENTIGLILELLLMIIIPLVIPLGIILVAGNLKYNQKIKSIIMIIFSMIYNFIIGSVSPSFIVCLALFTHNTILFIISLFVVFMIFVLPINIFMTKKGRINKALFININLIILIIGWYVGITLYRGSINL